MVCDYHFGLFLFNNYDGNKYISFQDLHDQMGFIDITMACDLSRRPDISHSKEIYTKRQTLNNTMHKIRPEYHNLERFH